MELKTYKVDVGNNDNYFVLAFSPEHAIVEVSDMLEDINASEFSMDKVSLCTKEEMEEVVIDYIYPENTYNDKILLKELVEIIDDIVVDNHKEFFGVLGDDFVAYGEPSKHMQKIIEKFLRGGETKE